MKNLRSYLLCGGLFFLCTVTLAQNYTTSSKKAIAFYEKAQEAFRYRLFDEGVDYLLRAIDKDEGFAEAHYKLAVTYQLFQETEEAAKYFKKTVEVAPDNRKFAGAFYNLSHYYLRKGNYEESRLAGEAFLDFKPNVQKTVDEIEKILRDIDFAQEAIKKPLSYQAKPMPEPLNQFYLQYFPSLTGDQNRIVFTARQTPPSNSLDSDENLYESIRTGEQWSTPTSLSENINTYGNEGTASISADGKVLVFTSCDRRESVNYGKCDLYITRKVGDTWSEPENLGPQVNSPAWDSHPSLSADGNTIYFISAREGGQGGKDIWYSTRDESGNWSPAKNLKAINTSMEELSPFIHPNGRTLFFSSNGYPSFGGYDIYKADLIDKAWSEAQNLGYPMNTYEDQVALFVTTDGSRGYYSQEKLRNNLVTSSELYQVEIPEEMRPKLRSNYVKGMVYDVKTKEKLEAKIELFDLTDDLKQASVYSDAQNGSYLLVLNEGSEYALEVTRRGYAFKSLTFNYSEGKHLDPLEIDIPLEPITQGTTFRLNNIFFDYNKYELKEKSKTELQELVKFMQENPGVRGEISGHTDNTGKASDNLQLSLNRAKAVYSYLIEAGISAERISYQGYGAERPAASNETDEGRARNRRIEFEIIEVKEEGK